MAITYSAALVDRLMQWENGELDFEDEAELFQHLVDTGMAWSLQGMYGRRASELLADGVIYKPA